MYQNYPDTTPQILHPTVEAKEPRNARRKWAWIGIGSIAAAVVLAGSVILVHQAGVIGGGDKNPFSSSVQEKAAYPLYYPQRMPFGWKVEDGSVAYTQDGAVTYTVSDGKKDGVFVVLQKLPPGFKFDETLGKQMTEQRSVQTPYGKAVLGLASNARLLSFEAGGTWMMMSGKKDLDQKKFETLAANLHEVR